MPYKKCSKCHETKDYKYFSKGGIRNGRQRCRLGVVIVIKKCMHQ